MQNLHELAKSEGSGFDWAHSLGRFGGECTQGARVRCST